MQFSCGCLVLSEYTYRKMGYCGFEWMDVGQEESFLGLKELSTSGRLSGIGGNTIVKRLHRISGKGEDLVKDWMGST